MQRSRTKSKSCNFAPRVFGWKNAHGVIVELEAMPEEFYPVDLTSELQKLVPLRICCLCASRRGGGIHRSRAIGYFEKSSGSAQLKPKTLREIAWQVDDAVAGTVEATGERASFEAFPS